MNVLVKKLIQFSQFLEDVKFGYALNSHEWEIMLIITSAELDSNILRVKDLLVMDRVASPATIHKCIKSLESKGFICITYDTKDARIKYLHPTKKGLNILQAVGKKM